MTMLPLPARPYAIAHRGASAYAHENTLAAFEKAAQLGADMWEADIRITSDGSVVVFHDAALPDGRKIAEMTLAEVRSALPACPLMRDVVALAQLHGAGIYADIKAIGAALPTLSALREAEISPVIIGAFDIQVVRLLREAGCTYPVSALVPIGEDPHRYAPEADVIHLCWEHMERPQDALTAELFQKAFADGQHIAIWHEEDPARMAEMRTKPVIGICSDRPELVNPFIAPSDYPFGIVCHRGANKIAPENTLPAFECALAAGFDFIELDLHISADGEIFVFHDADLSRTTNGYGPTCDKTLAELRTLDAGSWFDPFFAGTPIPTLHEVLALLHRYSGRAYLEFKTAPPERVIELVEAAGLSDRVFYWSFNSDFLRSARIHSSKAQIMARRQDYPTLAAAMADFGANLIEFLPNDDPFEIASLRGSAVKSMVAYNGHDTTVFDQMLDLRADLFNVNQPFSFARYANSRSRHV